MGSLIPRLDSGQLAITLHCDIGISLDRGCQSIVLIEENCLHEPLLRLPLCFDSRLCVDLDGKASAGMAHEFLDDLYVLAIRD